MNAVRCVYLPAEGRPVFSTCHFPIRVSSMAAAVMGVSQGLKPLVILALFGTTEVFP
jgi:hypothetical protein